jgi:hypothetical protein
LQKGIRIGFDASQGGAACDYDVSVGVNKKADVV